jgi:flagella synthesis protein FlgN
MATIDFTELKTLLHHDLSSLETLGELLREERLALGANDMATVEALVGRKNQLLDSVRERARQKVRHLVAAGFKPTSGAPSEFLQQSGDKELKDLWHATHQAMAECQAANSVNGQVINHLQKRIGRLSEIIRGVNPNQKLYGAGGREEAVSHKSVLANA